MVADVLAVDSLDTLYIMGLDKEFQEGRDWVADIFNPEPEVLFYCHKSRPFRLCPERTHFRGFSPKAHLLNVSVNSLGGNYIETGGGGRERPVLRVNEPEKGAPGQNPLVCT